MMRFLLRMLVRLLYRFEAFNEKALSQPGPLLLIPNHVSWLDWIFIGVCLEEDWKFVTSRTTAQLSFLHRFIMINRRTVPIDIHSPFAVKQMAEFLKKGGRLVLFAEGRISTTGARMKLFEGTGFLLYRTGARLITGYLRGASRIPFVRHSGWTKWFPKVTAHFSEALVPPAFEELSSADARKQLTCWLFDRLIEQEFEVEMAMGPATPLSAIEAMAASRPGGTALEDINREKVTYGKLLGSAVLLSRKLDQQIPSAHQRVGVCLPTCNGQPLVILALWMAGKIPALLNFSSGPGLRQVAFEMAGIKEVVTSRALAEESGVDLEALRERGVQLIFLEEIHPRTSAFSSWLAWRWRRFGFKAAVRHPEAETAVILFTSGAEGTPKGVELTHRNLMANIRQMLAVTDLMDSDRFFNCLPLFHAFGFTVGLLLPLVRGLYTFLYPSPLHHRIVPEIIYERACTVVLGTNTHLSAYARVAHPYNFHTVRLLFAGAEKLRETTANLWARKFGVRLLEGYGTTECSPCISVNTPFQHRFGSAGRFLPGMEHRLEPVDGILEGGRLLVKGPNVMRGYLNPEANARFEHREGWYDTGDLIRVDDEGYVHVLGRLKRFARIRGEMISLVALEETLEGAFPQHLNCEVVLLSRPDEDHGEKVVAVTNEPRIQLEEIQAVLKRADWPAFVHPREIERVPEIPRLPTGKVNYRHLANGAAD